MKPRPLSEESNQAFTTDAPAEATPQPSADGSGSTKVMTLRDARRRFERSYILSALARHDWSVPAAARSLGLQRPNLYRKARQLSIPLKPPGGDR